MIVTKSPYHHVFDGRERKGKWNETGAPTCLLVHHSLTFSSRRCVEVLQGRGLSTHYVIDPDGSIFETCDPTRMTAHAGEWNRAAIGIDLAAPYDPTYHNEFAKRIWGPLAFDKRFGSRKRRKPLILGAKKAHIPDTEAAIKSLNWLIDHLCERFSLPRTMAEPGKRYDDLDPTDLNQPIAVLAHGSVSRNRWDGFGALAQLETLELDDGNVEKEGK